MAFIELHRRRWPLFFFFGGAILIVVVSILPLLSNDLAGRMSASRNLWVSLLADYWFVALLLGLAIFAYTLWWMRATPRTIVIDGRRISVDGQSYLLSHAQIEQRKRAIAIGGLGERSFTINGAVYGQSGYEAARKALFQ